jgi:hypothetical protein
MSVANAAKTTKTVASPNAQYESVKRLWDISRAMCNGERYVKEFDGELDVNTFTNLLIPFSPSMTQEQYNFYKAEAELPGITAQFAKMLVGGLLRKQPVLTLPEGVPEGAADWIMNSFSQDGTSITSWLDKALTEEIQTSRGWLHVSYPHVASPEDLSSEERLAICPYATLWSADTVINWSTAPGVNGKEHLKYVVLRGYEEVLEVGEYHPTLRDTVWVHELDEAGFYQIRTYHSKRVVSNAPIVNGVQYLNPGDAPEGFEEDTTVSPFTEIMMNGKRLAYIPAWPLNGNFDVAAPLLSAIIDKEIALYNKMSRRNHLLYGAATYTPVIMSDMTDDDFDDVVSGGLGTWIRLRRGDSVDCLKTPTDALQDMDRAIASSIEEMAKLGLRMLSPESAQSGVALEIRNAAQTAQLGTLNTKISDTMKQVVVMMLNWRYKLTLTESDIDFKLSSDFNPIPLGADWLRLATEWYQEGLIPRSIWLQILKHNDMIAPDYDDEEGTKEINGDDLLLPKAGDKGTSDFANKLEPK